MIIFNATSRRACALSDDKLTTGSVGIPVEFSFSDDWTVAPARIAVFRGSGVSVDVALLEDSCTVPPEVLTQPGSTLTIGVYGTDGAGTVVIPTVYAEAGQIRRGAEPSGVDPTPQTQPLIDQLLAAAQAARDAADEAERLAQSVKDAADAGEFDGEDGEDGNGIWWVDVDYTQIFGKYVQAQVNHMQGRAGASPKVKDLCVISDGRLCSIYNISPNNVSVAMTEICNLSGMDGTSPSVTITETTGGHRITIIDKAHPDGQSFDVMDGQGGSGGNVQSVNGKTGEVELSASDVHALPDTTKIPSKTSQLQNDSGYLTQHQSLADYRTSQAQDEIDRQQNTAIAAKYTKPGGGIPASDLAAGVIPTVPSNVSSFTNDAGYLTLATLPVYTGGVS